MAALIIPNEECVDAICRHQKAEYHKYLLSWMLRGLFSRASETARAANPDPRSETTCTTARARVTTKKNTSPISDFFALYMPKRA